MKTEGKHADKLEKAIEEYLSHLTKPYEEPEQETYEALQAYAKNGGDIAKIARGQLNMIHGVDFNYKSEHWPTYDTEHNLQTALKEFEMNTVKDSSAGDQRASHVSYRHKLIADLFIETSKILIAGARVETIRFTDDPKFPVRIIKAVDEMIDAIDRSAEAKGIESLAEKIIDGFEKKPEPIDSANQKPQELKLAGDGLHCYQVQASRYIDPARPDDENSGKSIIEVRFFMSDNGVQYGAKIVTDDGFGAESITVQGFIGSVPVFTGPTRRTLRSPSIVKIERITTGNKWKGCAVNGVDDLTLEISYKKETFTFKAEQIQEFDPA